MNARTGTLDFRWHHFICAGLAGQHCWNLQLGSHWSATRPLLHQTLALSAGFSRTSQRSAPLPSLGHASLA